MNRFASTRSERRASQPTPGLAQCSVGSIDDDGIRYGFTTHALIASTIATAPAIVTIQSIAMRQGRGSPAVRRSIGLRDGRRFCTSGASATTGCGATADEGGGGAEGGGATGRSFEASYSARR